MFFSIVVVAACNRSLLTDEAQATIPTPRLKPTDLVQVDAVSHQSGAMEAIVKTSINGKTYNLKLRATILVGSGIQLETVGGAWIAPDIMMTGLREQERAVRVQAWVRKYGPKYAEAARLLDHFSNHLPRRLDHPFTEGRWDLIRRLGEKHMRAEKQPNEYPDTLHSIDG